MFTDLHKEKIFTGLILFSIALILLASYLKFYPENFELVYAVALSLLLGHYLFNSINVFCKLIMLGFFLGILVYIFSFMSWPYGRYFFMAGAVAQFIFGAHIFYKGIMDTMKTKDFEIFIYLLGGLLMITALINILPSVYLLFFNQRLLLENAEYLPFPLLGVILTIMVNENIWNDFIPEEKKLLNFVMLLQIYPLAKVLLTKYLL
ncbi:MAG: hypothetical protein ACJ75J_03605 [Cytophagaceae bacterium]